MLGQRLLITVQQYKDTSVGPLGHNVLCCRLAALHLISSVLIAAGERVNCLSPSSPSRAGSAESPHHRGAVSALSEGPSRARPSCKLSLIRIGIFGQCRLEYTEITKCWIYHVMRLGSTHTESKPGVCDRRHSWRRRRVPADVAPRQAQKGG